MLGKDRRRTVNSAGCGSTMTEYADLHVDDSAYAQRAADPLEVTVAYYDACPLAHAEGVRAQPRELLRGAPGRDLREVAEAELCCGSAVTYNVLHPGPARELGDLRTANPGC